MKDAKGRRPSTPLSQGKGGMVKRPPRLGGTPFPSQSPSQQSR
ncbi:hypothetical protein CCACVL1_23984 [Corchorus capsularis]|uniref:Uncharacterized protein n=1 Tax=Corchorus capsularis TaxID=210143 RepID=A0A1R3GRA8_COCAP|nr:hypothetical protein CCACVL1_23984 [Corchorus capsularis]